MAPEFLIFPCKFQPAFLILHFLVIIDVLFYSVVGRNRSEWKIEVPYSLSSLIAGPLKKGYLLLVPRLRNQKYPLGVLRAVPVVEQWVLLYRYR